MLSAPSAQQLALACGASGAYVDVTDDLITDSISGSWGRTSGFSDTRPGVFSFDLVNDSGKYTPGNTASSLATTVRVGMGVSHIVDGMHFSGTIRSAQPYFTGPASLSGSSKIRITCDDMLGSASRTDLQDIRDQLVAAATPYMYWPLDDAAGSGSAAEIMGSGFGPLVPYYETSVVTLQQGWTGGSSFGNPAVPPFSETQAKLVGVGSTSSDYLIGASANTNIQYPTSSMGHWGFWVTLDQTGSFFNFDVSTAANAAATTFIFRVGYDSTNKLFLLVPGPALTAYTPSADWFLRPHYISVGLATTFAAGVWTVVATLYIDGVSTLTRTWGTTPATLTTAQRQPVKLTIGQIFTTGSSTVSRVSHTLTRIPEEHLYGTLTEASVITLLDDVIPELTFDTLPANLSTATIGLDTSESSGLTMLNDVIRTEQGYLWVETTGTLTAPTPKIKIRARDRGETIDAAHTFTITEIQNAPEFTTDIENMVSTAVARGPSTSATTVDSSLVPYVGSASDSTNVLLSSQVDLLAWAQDRLLRGAIFGVRLPRITLDAIAINRWADISALRAGDRVRITGLPSQQLGVSQIDGWLLGASYSLRYPSLHGEDQMLFTFNMQPALPATAIYDTNRFMADGALTLSAGINSSVTSMSVATTGPKLETTAVPYDLLLDSEQVTVTACTGATPQVATITRAVNGTTAAAHTTSAVIEVPVPSLFAF